jgi:hypothetical protein
VPQALAIHVEAAFEDTCTIRGTIRASAPVTWVDPLASLPRPEDDLTTFRTFPGKIEQGEIAWEEAGPGAWRFVTHLPRRFDAQGCTARGAWVNGGWTPQPTRDGQPLPPVHWTVAVDAPGAALVVGETVGVGHAEWDGVAERVPLASMPHARLEVIGGDGWAVQLVQQGPRRKVLSKEITRLAELIGPRPAVVVEGPLRRRLTRAGPGVLFVSDRAFRLTPGLAGVHRVGVARGFLAAGLRGTDPWLREVAASALLPDAIRPLAAIDAARALRRVSWIPEIDNLLSSRRLPFYAEVLRDPVPGDPLADDLAERLAPAYAPSLVAAQLADRFGLERRRALAQAVAAGAAPDTAEAEAGLPPGWLATWRRPPVREDYELTVSTGDDPRVEVLREAPAGAPDETVIVQIDGAALTRTGPPGPFVFRLPTDPERVRLDPGAHIDQSSRLGDVWPPHFTTTFAAGIDSINLTQGLISASAHSTLRRTGDTHNVFSATLAHNEVNVASLRLGWSRREGPLLDGFARPHRFSISPAISLLDPDFSAAAGNQLALDLGIGWSTDTRVSWEFPLSGHRLYASVGGGAIPATGETWTSAGAGANAVASPHPRHAIAGRLGGTLAESAIAHRLLGLGGAGVMASIPELPACDDAADTGCLPVATARALAGVEYRVAVIRGASVPGVLAWGSELQLTTGLEAILANAEGPLWATGATVGVTGIYDVLGAQPSLIGVTAGWPLAWSGLSLERTAVPQLYLRWSQAF